MFESFQHRIPVVDFKLSVDHKGILITHIVHVGRPDDIFTLVTESPELVGAVGWDYDQLGYRVSGGAGLRTFRDWLGQRGYHIGVASRQGGCDE